MTGISSITSGMPAQLPSCWAILFSPRRIVSQLSSFKPSTLTPCGWRHRGGFGGSHWHRAILGTPFGPGRARLGGLARLYRLRIGRYRGHEVALLLRIKAG